MFASCKTAEETKKLYHRLAKYLHPDQGGENELMILLTDTYESKIRVLSFIESHIPQPKKEARKPSKPEVYEKVHHEVLPEDDEITIIDEILLYGESHKKFNCNYVESIKEYLEENGYITASQYNSLVKIYYAFRMDT